jgi:hypothetical protein
VDLVEVRLMVWRLAVVSQQQVLQWESVKAQQLAQ